MFMLIGGLGGAFLLSLVMNQEQMLYVPVIQGIKTNQQNPRGLKNPSEQGLNYEEHWLPVPEEEGLKLHAWFLPAPMNERTATTLLFCHENAGNIGLRLQEFRYVHKAMGVNQIVFDYRGYGNTKGTQQPSEEGLIADARTVLDYLKTLGKEGKIDYSKVILCGRSLGGAVVVQLAAELCRNEKKTGEPAGIAGVIVENSFTSIEDMADSMFPFLKLLGSVKRSLMRLKWRSIDVIHEITLPLLFLSADKDEIVPKVQMHMLKSKASAAICEMHTFKDASHNDIWEKGGAEYWTAKKEFVDRVSLLNSKKN